MNRFYKIVATDQTPDGWRILLDGKPVQTPGRHALLLPTAALAEAVALEWRGQGDKIDPMSMPMQRLANTVQDGIKPDPAPVVAAILRFGEHDLLSYRASEPASLITRQRESWDPMLAWAAERYGAHLSVTQGVGHVEQTPEALATLERAVVAHGAFALASLHVVASITGSLVLALALADGAINPAQAFQLSRIDELHQAEFWGTDSGAQKRADLLAHEIDIAAAFMAAARA